MRSLWCRTILWNAGTLKTYYANSVRLWWDGTSRALGSRPLLRHLAAHCGHCRALAWLLPLLGDFRDVGEVIDQKRRGSTICPRSRDRRVTVGRVLKRERELCHTSSTSLCLFLPPLPLPPLPRVAASSILDTCLWINLTPRSSSASFNHLRYTLGRTEMVVNASPAPDWNLSGSSSLGISRN